jgi:probable phosphoglycerate mutase
VNDRPGRILLVRHGETDWNREGRLQGWAPSSLTDRGRNQARRLGRHLASAYDVDRTVASDLRRTRETAAVLRETGLPAATFDRAWRERDVGVFRGFEKAELFETHPEYAAESGTMAVRAQPPEGERLLDAYERVREAFGELRAAVDDGTVLVVTHGGPISIVLGLVDGQDLLTAVTDHSQANCSVNELRLARGSGEPRIVRENETVDGTETGE